jgi:hypothetical protein
MGRKENRSTPHIRHRKTAKRGKSTSSPESAARPTFAGLLHDGSRLATIEEVLDPDIGTRTWKELSSEEAQRLCLRRIKDNNNFISMRMLGTADVVDKKRALTEVKRLSPIGLHLIEIERRYIRLQLEHHHRQTTKGMR